MMAARALAVAVVLAVVLAGCDAGSGANAPDAGGDPLLTIRFEDVEAPEILEIEAVARPVPAEAGAGLWAAVPGLVRPERGRVTRADGAAEVVVALYRAAAGQGLSLSAEAAQALGIAAPAGVRIVALRPLPRLGGSALGRDPSSGCEPAGTC
jgi:hypothetical protein